MIQQNQHGASAIAALPCGKNLFFRRIMFGSATAMTFNALTIAGIHFVGGSLLASRASSERDQLNFHTFHTLLEIDIWMSALLGECWYGHSRVRQEDKERGSKTRAKMLQGRMRSYNFKAEPIKR